MEVRWTSMPPNGRAADRRAPGACARRVEASADSGEKRRGFSRHPGCPFFWSLFFGQAKKSDLPWVSHPQVAVEITCKARDTIQSLDARLRGHDNKHS